MKVRLDASDDFDYTFSPTALRAWNPNLRKVQDDDTSISIFDPIGDSRFVEGVTANRISAALRRIGNRNVTVNINSPGGLMFEGIAIYNLLRNHRGLVRVNVLGIAASAASVIAMAGDEIIMNTGSQMMIHNPQATGIGDYAMFRDMAEVLEGFRDSVLEIYGNRTLRNDEELIKMLDDETFMTARQAVDNQFADGVDEIETREEPNNDLRSVNTRNKNIEMVHVALAREGLTRKERSALYKELGIVAPVTDDTDRVAPVTDSHCSDTRVSRKLSNLLNTVKGRT